jgi:hypothetical protein
LSLYLHHGALIAYRNQDTYDLIIPVAFASDNENITMENMSFIIIQCKNWAQDHQVTKFKEFVRKVRDMDATHNIEKPYVAFWASVGVRSTSDTPKGAGYFECFEYNCEEDENRYNDHERKRLTPKDYIPHIVLRTMGVSKIFQVPEDCLPGIETLLKNHDKSELFSFAQYFIEEEKDCAVKPISGGWLPKEEIEPDIVRKVKRIRLQ